MAKKVLKSISKSNSKSMPMGVKILSVLSFIGAAFGLIFGILALIGSGFVGPLIEEAQAEIPGWIGTAALGAVGVFLILCAILDFFIGRGLWKGQEWSRVLLLVLLSIGLVGSVFSFELGSIVVIIVEAFLIWYLGFNKSVRESFN